MTQGEGRSDRPSCPSMCPSGELQAPTLPGLRRGLEYIRRTLKFSPVLTPTKRRHYTK